jgi:hypothetical protein
VSRAAPRRRHRAERVRPTPQHTPPRAQPSMRAIVDREASSTQLKSAKLAKIAITELEPADGAFVGKVIKSDGSILPYQKHTWWRQRVAFVPATPRALYQYFCEARSRNICVIRGAPANPSRQPTRRWKAHVMHRGRNRGDHGFIDEPTSLFFLDVDGAMEHWTKNPQRAVSDIVARLGEPWRNTSYVWFFTASHGLLLDEHKRWHGELNDKRVRVRLAFITARPLSEVEARALTHILRRTCIAELDPSISNCVQPNYITRPRWELHPERDVLGNIRNIGWVQGAEEYLAIPDDLTNQARWARAQGHDVDIAQHPDAVTAVRGIASDGSIRPHLKSAVQHLLQVNPPSEVVSFADHAITIVSELQRMVERHQGAIDINLRRHGRSWGDVHEYLPDNMIGWAQWLMEHPPSRGRKRIRLVKGAPQVKVNGSLA